MNKVAFHRREVVTMGVLGRLSIPSKIRKLLEIEAGDELELSVYGRTIIIRKLQEANKDNETVLTVE